MSGRLLPEGKRAGLRAWRAILGLIACFAIPLSALASELPPAQVYLQQAAAATRQIELGGDQSAARRDIALTVLPLDQQAARDALAGIGRPSDAARVLAALAASLTATDPEAARQAAALGDRLLQRIPSPARRAQENRLFLQEIAGLGADAPAAVSELTPEEARPLVVAALADTDPARALALLKTWDLKGPAMDAVLARLAPRLAATDAETALTLAESISLPVPHDLSLWRLAEARPVEETAEIAGRMQDPLFRAGALRSAALRQAATSVEAAQAALSAVDVSLPSAQAELAVAVAVGDEQAGVTLARSLPTPARTWALTQIALSVAATQPARAEEYLQEAKASAEAVTLVAARMAPADPDRALRLAGALPEEARDRARAEVSAALPPTQAARATQVLLEIASPEARDWAVVALAGGIAQKDVDAATGLLGVVSDESILPECRGRIAAAAAPHDLAGARRLLSSLPKGEVRTRCALQAAAAQLAAGGTLDAAVTTAALGLDPDLARRWLLPEAARQGLVGMEAEAGQITNPYWKCLALVDVARALQREAPAPRPAPERARLVRPVFDWEGS